jgi:hypothetical protein
MGRQQMSSCFIKNSRHYDVWRSGGIIPYTYSLDGGDWLASRSTCLIHWTQGPETH